MKALTKTDRIFLAVLAAACLLQLFFLFGPPLLDDEGFYLSFPFRLVQGDSLVQDEWHLAQFSSLFSYLPVWLWCTLRGSADGLIVFMRCLYLAIHTALSVLIYKVFRKAGIPAIAAALFYYLQTPYRIYSISYHSMFVVFLLLFTFSLLSIYQKGDKKFSFAAGASFGACCVNNPLFCLLPLLYLLLLLLWVKRDGVADLAAKRRYKKKSKTKQPKAGGRKAVSKEIAPSTSAQMESYGCFFKKQTILYLILGTAAVAAVSVAFFFGTGGTIASLQQNLNYLFGTSEYHLASFSMHEKLKQFWEAIYYSSFRMPFLLPLLFLALLVDKKRKADSHRIVYLSVSIALSVLILIGSLIRANLSSLPLALLSFVCYLLTEKKNRVLFFCVWCPCAAAAVLSSFAANVPLAAIGTILPVGNIAGVFFAWDLLQELRQQQTDKPAEQKTGNKASTFCRAVICAGLVLQLLIHVAALMFGQLPAKDAAWIREGPLSGIRMPQSQAASYKTFLRDLDEVKACSAEDDPLLIVAYENWLYLYAERPIATYTVWYRGQIMTDDLLLYYQVNPQKIPEFIYVADSESFNTSILQDLFSFTETPLAGGVLLTVTDCVFES